MSLTLDLPPSLSFCSRWMGTLLAPEPGRAPGWRVVDAARLASKAGSLAVRAEAGQELIILLSCDGRGGYLLDGPLRWPDTPGRRPLRATWRKTLRGPLPDDVGQSARIAWLDGDLVGDAWPRCGRVDARAWECVGVPVGRPGLALFPDAAPVTFALAPVLAQVGAVQPVSLSRATWGRRLQVVSPVAMTAEADIEVSGVQWRTSRWRQSSQRLREERDPGVMVVGLGPDLFWVAGAGREPNGGIRIAGSMLATAIVPFDGWELGPPEIPHVVNVEPAVPVPGQVVTENGEPATGTLIMISQPIRLPADPPTAPGDPPRTWRIVAEAQADADGRFQVEGLGRGLYELAALHAVHGRLIVRRRIDGTALVLTLRAPRRARGIVVRQGVPLGGVPVRTAPDLQQYVAAADVVDVIGGETVTGPDGRFVLALPPDGVVQIVAGTPELGMVRRTLGSAGSLPPITDLGAIELTGAIRLFVRLDGWDACELQAAGPFGSSGVSMLVATPVSPGLRRFDLPEPGRWVLTLSCGSREVSVLPPFVDVAPDTPETVVQLGVPPEF